MRLLQRNASRSIVVLAKVQSQPLQRMTFALRIAPPAHVLQPLRSVHHPGTAGRPPRNIAAIAMPMLLLPLIVRKLHILPGVPRGPEAVHIDQPRHAHKSMLAGRRPQAVRAARRKQHRMAVCQRAHRFREDRLLQNVIVARLLTPEVERAGQPFVSVVGARVVRRHVHLGGLAAPAGPEIQRHVLPVADVAPEIAPRAQALSE